MTRKFYNIVILLYLFIILAFPCRVGALSVNEQRDALMQTAKAFYYKGSYVQYDSYRKTAIATPEDASVNHTIYTDCGIFVYQVYNQTLGINIPDSSFDLANYANSIKSNNVIFNLSAKYKNGSYDNSNILEEFNKWLNGSFNFETGDVLVFRRIDGSGHVMLIDAADKNNVKLYESGYTTNGGYYDATNHIDKVESRSISYSALSTKLKNAIALSNNNSNSIRQVSVLRFITDGTSWTNQQNRKENYTVTNSALTRLKYKGLEISKTAAVTNTAAQVSLDTTVPGSTIKYTITIKNNSATNYNNLYVEEKKDSLVSFNETNRGRINNDYISWQINVKAGSSYNIEYSVNIPSDDNLLGKSIVSTGRVDNVPTLTIKHYLLNSLSNENVAKLKNAYNSLQNDNSSDIEFISKIFKQAFDYDLSYLNNFNFNQILSMASCGKEDYCWGDITNNNVRNITLLNYYGLRITPYSYKNTNGINTLSENLVNANLAWDVYGKDEENRAREIKINDIQPGDIIIYKNDILKAYLYLGNGELVRKNSRNIEHLYSDATTNFLQNIVGDNYMILRPAIMMNSTYVGNVNNGVGTSNNLKRGPVKKKIVGTMDGVEVNISGVENPDCGYTIPALFILTLGGLLILIKLKLKPDKLFKLK